MKKQNSREALARVFGTVLEAAKSSKKKVADRAKAKYKVTGPKVSLASESKRKSRFSK
jgi:hypothetical protein